MKTIGNHSSTLREEKSKVEKGLYSVPLSEIIQMETEGFIADSSGSVTDMSEDELSKVQGLSPANQINA
jgi:hypothetical protein